MRFKNIIPSILIILLAIAVATILWLTIFSRLGTDSRHFYPPFWSYRAIVQGSSTTLLQNSGNVVLFVPIGLVIALYLRLETKQSFLVGFILSLLIESCQWFFRLGSFEFDDLLHNTAGAGIGAYLVWRTSLGVWLQLQVRNKKKSLLVLGSFVALFLCLKAVNQGIRIEGMRQLAALNDKNGIKNLLVLTPDPIYVGNTDVSIIYNSDGSIVLQGKSESRAWIQIAKFELVPGQYYLEGLSGLQKNTLGLELAVFDDEQNRYLMVGHEVGAIDRLDFALQGISKVEVLVSIYPGWEGRIIARPVIFRKNSELWQK